MLWIISNDLQGDSAAIIAVMGKDAFLRMARSEMERLLQQAAESERNHHTTQATLRFKRAVAIDEELRLYA